MTQKISGGGGMVKSSLMVEFNLRQVPNAVHLWVFLLAL